MNYKHTSTIRFIVLGVLVFTAAVLLSACGNTNNKGNTGTDNSSYVPYTNRENVYTIQVPESWNLVEDADTNIQSVDKIHLSPKGYTSDVYPHLLTIDHSSFSMDQNVEIFGLTNTILESEDIDWSDKYKAKRLKLQDKVNKQIANIYIAQYPANTSIYFYLRSDDQEYVSVLKKMWDTYIILR